MSEITTYTDAKANAINGFDLLSNFMWRRADYLLQARYETMEQVDVADPCAGGGKLLTQAKKSNNLFGWEADHTTYAYLEAILKDYGTGDNHAFNIAFEEYFTKESVPMFELVMSIPYTDRTINSTLEKEAEYLKFKNYAYYIICRSMDILVEGGIGIFAIPKTLMDETLFEYEIDQITQKANILSIEGFEEYSIITLKKDKI